MILLLNLASDMGTVCIIYRFTEDYEEVIHALKIGYLHISTSLKFKKHFMQTQLIFHFTGIFAKGFSLSLCSFLSFQFLININVFINYVVTYIWGM